MAKDRRKVIFTKHISTTPTIIGRKKIKVTDKFVTLGKEQYPVDTALPTYRNKNRFIYMLDIDIGQMYFGSSQCIQSDDMFDMIFHKRVIKDLVAGLEKRGINSDTIIIALFVGLAALAGGYVLGNAIPLG